MKTWSEKAPALRTERHFGDRVLQCFAERPGGLLQMLDEAVQRNAAGEALACGDARLSWRELQDRVARAAGVLAQRGIRRGDRVALLLGNRLEFPLALLGAAWLGAICVPIGIREQKPGLEYILRHCGASMLVYDAELADRLPGREETPRLRERLTADEFASLINKTQVIASSPPGEDDTAAILYTSGTTGRPKGAMLTNLGIVHSAMNFELGMRLTPRSRSVAAVPLSHVTGVIALLAATVRCAGTLIILPAFKAQEFLAVAERERMTHTLMVPAMYNLCLLEPRFPEYDLSSWLIGSYGGAPMPAATIAALAQKLPGLALMNAYGATETTSPATLMPPEETARRRESVGLAVPGAEIQLVEEELWIRGPMVVKGYWDDPAASEREFTDGFWHSGDLGSIDGEGFVRVLDRKKDMINRGGFKVYSAEVESTLAEHPAVLESAVLGVPCPVLGERVHAFVTLRPPGVSEQALREFCSQRLSDYKVPEKFSLGEEPLPRNANGKVLKRLLRELTTS
jgi:acyl-CoA synthetase (AMP-forming)/AMP-acid ligase II